MKAIRPYLTVKNSHELLAFYQKVFKAEVVGEILYLDHIPGFEKHKGEIGHAELKIGDSHLYLSEETREEGPDSTKIHLILEMDSTEELLDCYNQLIIDGTIYQEPSEQSWSELSCYVRDKFGITWSLFYHLK